MKLAIASLVLGSAAAFQPHSALNAVPKSSSALDMKVRFPFFEHANECVHYRPVIQQGQEEEA